MEVAAEYPFLLAARRMEYVRSKSRPKIPQTLGDLGRSLGEQRGEKFARCIKSNFQFFRTATDQFVLFISPRTAW